MALASTIASSGVGAPALRTERRPSSASTAAMSTSTPPTISPAAHQGDGERERGDGGEQEGEQREQDERDRDGDEHRRLRVHLDLLDDLGLGEIDLGMDERGDVLAQPAEEVLDSVGREHEP